MGVGALLVLGPVPDDRPLEHVLEELADVGVERTRRLDGPNRALFAGLTGPEEDTADLAMRWSEACGKAWAMKVWDALGVGGAAFAEDGTLVWEDSAGGGDYRAPLQRALQEAIGGALEFEELARRLEDGGQEPIPLPAPGSPPAAGE
jgi:hypothetical protein